MSSCSRVARSRRRKGRSYQSETRRGRDAGGRRHAPRAPRGPHRSHRARHVGGRCESRAARRASWSSTPPTTPPAFKVEKREGDVVLETSQLVAHVSLANGAVQFTDLAGKPLLAEEPSRKLEAGVSQRFNAGTDEAFYGSGQHQNAQMNLNGEDVELAQHNMDIGVPFVVSTPQLRRAVGQQLASRASAIRSLWPRIARSQDPRRGGQGRRLHRALLHRRAAQARARREGHQLPVHPRSLQLAEGIARWRRSRPPARRPTSCRTRR